MDLSRYEKMPPVGAAMTPFPYFAEATQPLAEVERLMVEHRIRHVPVKDHGRVVGIVSDHDLRKLRAPGTALRTSVLLARDVMVREPFVVEITTPLHHVVREMAERRIGSAIVVKQGKLAGILSATDVCRVLAEILVESFPKGGDDAA